MESDPTEFRQFVLELLDKELTQKGYVRSDEYKWLKGRLWIKGDVKVYAFPFYDAIAGDISGITQFPKMIWRGHCSTVNSFVKQVTKNEC